MDRYRASEIHADDGMRIIAIESVRYSARQFAGLYQLSASIEPTALVVCTADDNRLVNLTRADNTLENLQRQVRGLSALLVEGGI